MDESVDVEYDICDMSHIHMPKEFGRRRGVKNICVVSFSLMKWYNPMYVPLECQHYDNLVC